MESESRTYQSLLEENADLRARLEESEELLRAIRAGEVDAIVVEANAGPQLFTLQGLDAQQNRFRGEMLAQVSDAVIAVDLDERVTFMNAAAEQQYRVQACDMLGRKLSEIFTRCWACEEDECALQSALREHGKWRGELLQHVHDGRKLLVESTVTKLHAPDGECIGVVAAVRDISERKQAEEALRKSEARLSGILRRSPAGIVQIDASGCMTMVNQRWCDMLGYTEGELLGKSVLEITHESSIQATTGAFERCAAGGPDLQIEKTYRRKDGSLLSAQSNLTPMRSPSGEFLGLIAVVLDITERLRIEKELRDKAHFLERIAEVMPGVLTVVDLESNENVFVNRNVASILGYDCDEVEKFGTDALRQLIHPEDFPRLQQHLDQIRSLDSSSTAMFEYRMQHKSGQWHWFESRDAIFSRNNAGEAVQYIGVASDITDRKRAEEGLRQNAALFSRLIEQAPMGTYVVDAHFRIQQVNAEALPVFQSVQPLIGRDFQEVIEIVWGKEVGGRVASNFRRTLETGERYVSPPFTEMRRDLGIRETYEWETQRVTLPDGQHGVACYFHEVTERAQATEALRASEQRMRLATEATQVGIWEWNVLTNTIRWDAEMFRIYGIEQSGEGFVSYADWQAAVLPEDLAENEAILNDTVQRRGKSSRTFRIRRFSDGKCRNVAAVETVRTNDQDQVEWVVGTNLDITERKQVEEELRRLAAELSEADRRKDEFLATLAHELRNPLAPIRNGLQIMGASTDKAAIEEVRTMMERQLGQMVHLVDDLLDVSRISRGKLELRKQRVQLSAVLSNAVETSRPLIESSGHELIVDVPTESIILDADVTRLGQVFSNLLNNAAKYSDHGGRIWLTAELQGNQVVVSVKDTGIGIPKEMAPIIFDMFTQVDRSLEKAQGGLGIGLSLVKRLVELHDGTVQARSEGSGQGSEFIVRLPVNGVLAAESKPAESGKAATATSQRRILVADDNKDAATTLAMMLRFMGNEVRTANDGLQAIEVGTVFHPDVILLDIGMPKLNGYETCRRIRKQPWGESILLIALTGWGQDDDKRRSREAGFDHHLVKPVDPAELKSLLAGYQPA